eukprot:CAMPEP_0172451056 /NCGR_PEP_ID=MMETSP1065-20121228/9220_1 /TAXON_ID=265537 /ORGANISM="Amphiprora paludosa, Strain CCMP125" /LENGTH=92 /DNA_ID=CAMNT_0013202947 /DNA_START=6 /DNA_END=280 /DNA_ORIENTATION=-
MSDRRSGGSYGAMKEGDSQEELATLLREASELVRDGKRSDPVLNKALEAFLTYMEHPGNPRTQAMHKQSSTKGASAVTGMFHRMMKAAGTGV